MIPITLPQAQAFFDALMGILKSRMGPVGALAASAVQVAVDQVGLPALWAELKKDGIVS